MACSLLPIYAAASLTVRSRDGSSNDRDKYRSYTRGRRTPRSGEGGCTEPVGSRGSLLRAIDAVLIAVPAQWRYRPRTLAERRRHLRIVCVHNAAVHGKLTDARAQIP